MSSGEKTDKGPLVYLVGAGLVFSFLAGTVVSNPSVFGSFSNPGSYAPTTRHYTLVIEGAGVPEGPSALWHAWTYNGTVPGPTLHAWIGDRIFVKVINKLDLIHSLHTHLVNYNFTSDGSQANIIAGMGASSMIMPGQSYTYYFSATYAGVFLYHCHSSDQHPISYHMGQGLYGVIVIDDPKKPPPPIAHDFTVVMSEMGPKVTGTGAAPYIMDGMGFPGGEPALMNLYTSQGITGVVGQLNKTLLAFEAKVGETIRFNLANAGNLAHTFHLHDAELVSEFQFPGVPYNDANVPLDPAVTDSVLVTLTQPGIFLFHCHVVSHADAGMIGVLVVHPAASSSTSSTTNTTTFRSSTATTTSPRLSPFTSMVSIFPSSAANISSKGYSPNVINVIIEVNNTVMWTNNDSQPHTATSDTGLFDSLNLNAGQSWTYTFETPGTYNYHCTYHYWMTGTIVVSSGP